MGHCSGQLAVAVAAIRIQGRPRRAAQRHMQIAPRRGTAREGVWYWTEAYLRLSFGRTYWPRVVGDVVRMT
jgi:hypothetical protein